MTDKEIREYIESLINQGESVEVEFKSARGGLPASLWESYSAFANTNGGVIVLGIQEKNGKFFFDGLTKETAVRYQKNFWDLAHNRGKVSVCLPHEDDVKLVELEGAYILICEIPRADYELRPVFLNNTPFGNTYRRNHEGDYLCTDAEVRRMFADADHDRHSQDGRILIGYDFERDIDIETLRQYRWTFASLQPTHPWVGLDDMEFLRKIGAYTTEYETGKSGFTLAGILMFGKYDSIINNSGDPDFFVDYREKTATDDPNIRWTHRIYPDGMWEANLYQFYVKVYNRLIQALPRPFVLKDGVRQEETPAHDAVREALINCIIHADIQAMGNIVVERTDNALTFRNPGMMLVSKQQYFEGGRSICRNPILQKMFMRLGRAEKAGSGVDKIVSGWRSLGWDTPSVAEETRPDYVVLTMQIGKPIKKTHQENPSRKPIKKTHQESPAGKPDKVEKRMMQILDFCIEAKTFQEILEFTELKDRVSFKKVYIEPLMASGRLRMTDPDNPRSRKQQYITVKK
ncbi:putative DNA binding domain-containing protein [Parabacteroides distasonis]|uniref:Fic family protein n=1 Tax=Bacteroidales TaxID=171549 RepID=UPI00189A2C31|nr:MULTISPECIES: RNA-binding domain-containing protein [Bacteroidales]MBV4225673.1 putative DNA binding domain-containing protein [Parabacteroides distasonis]